MHTIRDHGVGAAALVLLLILQPVLSGCARDAAEDSDSASGHTSPQFIEVVLGVEGGMSINGETTTGGDFGAEVERVAKRSRSTVVIRVEAEDRCPMSVLALVQNELRARGLFNTVYKGASGEELSLILPSVDQTLESVPEKHLAHIRVPAVGSVTLDGAMVEADALETLIADHLARDAYLVVAIDSEQEATYGDFFRVFGAAKRAKAQRIHLNVDL